MWVASLGVDATFRTESWEIGALRGAKLVIGGGQVVGAQQAAISAPAAGATVDGEARAVIGQMLVALRGHGLIAP